MATMTTADSILKEFYEGAAQEQLNNDNGVFAYAEKNSKDIEGRRAVLAPHVGRNSGVGARAEGGTLPTAGSQDWDEQRIPLLRNYGRIQLSGPLLKASKSDRGSFRRALDAEMKGVVSDLKRDVNRQAWGTSNGIIATAGLTTSSLQVQLSTTYGPTSTVFNQLEAGMVVDIGTVAAPTLKASGVTIARIDSTSGAAYIEVGSAVTTTGTDYIFRSGSGGTSKEITGLQTIVSASGTLFNVVATGPWKSTVNGNSGTNRSLTEPLMARVVMDIGIAAGSAATNDLIGVGSSGVYRAFANLQTSLKRYNNTIDMKGGWKGLEFSSGTSPISITFDRDCPNNSLFFLNTKHYTEYQMSDWEFMDQDGAILSRVANTDAYEATLFKYHETAIDQRNCHGLIQDVTEAT